MNALQGIANHLWQSTAFAALVALATLAFRQNRAAVRHALWLAASMKFLVPFAALVALGGSLGVRVAPGRTIERTVTIVLNGADHGAFPSLPVGLTPPASLVPTASAGIGMLAAIGIAAWIVGSLAILAVWMVRWRRVAALTRAAMCIDSGRDLEALREIERRTGRTKPIAFVSSESSLEPGVFGILRPVLLWPKTIADHLGQEQIVTILAHEVSHVRRRDNVAAAIHMVVEGLFWFHPLVWWIGARLVDERERACDEDVLQSGSEPAVYAATIIQACRIYIESPLACVAGVTGSDLNRRIERIMTSGRSRALSPWHKMLLATGAMAAIAAPIAVGAAAPPRPRMERRSAEAIALRVRRPLMLQVSPPGGAPLPKFEVASVKPNGSGDAKVQIQTLPGGRFNATNVTVRFLIQFAYGLQPSQTIGGPDWLSTDRFDIVAKGDDAVNAFEAARTGEPSRTQLMLRALLSERFGLGVRTESRELPIYALVVANRDGRLGPQLKRSTADCSADSASCGIRIGRGPGTMVVGGASLTQVANSLTSWAGRLVVDRTGLAGTFDLTLSWTPDQLPRGFDKKIAAGSLTPADPNGPSIFTAVQEQLGLKLESQKEPVDVLVIDRAEHPFEN